MHMQPEHSSTIASTRTLCMLELAEAQTTLCLDTEQRVRLDKV